MKPEFWKIPTPTLSADDIQSKYQILVQRLQEITTEYAHDCFATRRDVQISKASIEKDRYFS